jgi:predicted LPLAT superfamily acyltransferase
MAATWTTHRERGNPAILRLFVWIALTLGRRLARLLLYPIVLYFVFAGGAARAASRDYMKRVLGREPTPIDGYRHVHCFASTILDRAYLLNDRHDLFRIEVTGKEIGLRALRGRPMSDGSIRRGAFLIGAHVGSFESIRAAGHEEKDLRVSMVMYEDNAQVLNQVLEAINPKMAKSIIPLGRVDSMLHVKRALDDGGFVGMLADRTLAEEEGTSAVRRINVLGTPTSIPIGPFRMAAMLRRPAIFIIGLYRGGNRYEVHYEELHDFAALDELPRVERAAATGAAIDCAMARYVARLEHFCREAPYNWFNFYDYWDDASRPGSYQAIRRAAKKGSS